MRISDWSADVCSSDLGAIAQALERAYRDGVRDDPAAAFQAPEQDDAGPLEWALIPPRPRDAFWSICLYTLGRDTDLPRDGHLAPAITERGTPGWTLVAGGYSPDRVISDRSIGPLVRLGLIALAVDLPRSEEHTSELQSLNR